MPTADRVRGLIPTRKRTAPWVCTLLLAAVAIATPVIGSETTGPHDVHRLLQAAKSEVERIRLDVGVTSPWPAVGVSGERHLRHVLQKCLETLEKVNRGHLGIAESARRFTSAGDETASYVCRSVEHARRLLESVLQQDASDGGQGSLALGNP
jgi:hypothetical protein